MTRKWAIVAGLLFAAPAAAQVMTLSTVYETRRDCQSALNDLRRDGSVKGPATCMEAFGGWVVYVFPPN